MNATHQQTTDAVWRWMIDHNGQSPRLIDLASLLNLRSVSAAKERVDAAIDAGLLKYGRGGGSQSIEPTAWGQICDRSGDMLAIIQAVASGSVSEALCMKAAEIMTLVGKRCITSGRVDRLANVG